MPHNLFDQVVTQLLTDNTVASANMAAKGGQGGGEYNSADTYQRGDARIPNVLGATITRKGKVFIARTGDVIENISFESVALGDGTFDTYSVDSSMYGQLRKVRNLHAKTCRIYWDEPQKDGTFVRYWGIVTQVEETHGTGGARSIVNYSFNVMIEEIALIDVGGTLMTDVFPLGGVSDGLDFS